MSEELAPQIVDWFLRLAKETQAFSIQRRSVSPHDLDPAFSPIHGAPPKWTPDVVLEIRPAKQRTSLFFRIEARSRITPSEALATLDRMKTGMPGGTPVLCVPAISERVAEMCRERGIGYLDEAGNCRITAPGLFIQIEGRQNVRPDTRSAVDIYATKSSRMIRILLTHPNRGWQVQSLATEAKISLGLASKVKNALVEQAFVEERNGLLYPREPEQLLNEWSKKYPTQTRSLALYTPHKPRETEKRVAEWCRSHSLRYALTQFSGAERFAPMVRYSRSTIYVDMQLDVHQLTDHLDLKPVSSGANLVFCQPFDSFVFYDNREVDGINVVSPIQLYLDLIRESGRGEEAAQEILEKEIKRKW